MRLGLCQQRNFVSATEGWKSLVFERFPRKSYPLQLFVCFYCTMNLAVGKYKMQKFSRSFLLCFLIFVVSGCSTIPGTRHPSTSAADAQFAADPLEASLDNLRAYVISKQLDRSYWSAPLTSDVTSEALMLAVGIRMGKMNRELRDSYVQSMSDRMEPGRE